MMTMTTDLAIRTDVPDAFHEQKAMAQILAESNLLPSHLRGKPANVLLIMMGARALNIPAFWAFQSMFVVDGKLSQSADLMKALVIRAGHTFRVVERSAVRAVVEIKRHDRDEPYRAEFTWDDAKTAKLTNKDNWQKYPKAMMVARAASVAVRDECPEVLFGVLYTPDELGAVTDDEGTPVEADGVIEMPTPDRIQEMADALTTWRGAVEFSTYWKAVVDLGWALEKVPATDDSLTDLAVHTLRMRAMHPDTDTLDKIRELWAVAKVAELLGLACSEGGTLAETMMDRAAFLREFEEAKKARNDRPEPSPPAIVDVPPPGEYVTTADLAAAVQQAAADSWNEEKAP